MKDISAPKIVQRKYQLYNLKIPSFNFTLCSHPIDRILLISIHFFIVPSGFELLNTNSPLNPIISLIISDNFDIEISEPVPHIYMFIMIL